MARWIDLSGADLPAPVGFENPAFRQAGFSFWEGCMDRKEGFPPHVIGFMKRKRENGALPLNLSDGSKTYNMTGGIYGAPVVSSTTP